MVLRAGCRAWQIVARLAARTALRVGTDGHERLRPCEVARVEVTLRCHEDKVGRRCLPVKVDVRAMGAPLDVRIGGWR